LPTIRATTLKGWYWPIPAVEGDVALAFLVLAEGPYISLFARSASTLSPE
jgi:hypothetical protein